MAQRFLDEKTAGIYVAEIVGWVQRCETHAVSSVGLAPLDPPYQDSRPDSLDRPQQTTAPGGGKRVSAHASL